MTESALPIHRQGQGFPVLWQGQGLPPSHAWTWGLGLPQYRYCMRKASCTCAHCHSARYRYCVVHALPGDNHKSITVAGERGGQGPGGRTSMFPASKLLDTSMAAVLTGALELCSLWCCESRVRRGLRLRRGVRPRFTTIIEIQIKGTSPQGLLLLARCTRFRSRSRATTPLMPCPTFGIAPPQRCRDLSLLPVQWRLPAPPVPHLGLLSGAEPPRCTTHLQHCLPGANAARALPVTLFVVR